MHVELPFSPAVERDEIAGGRACMAPVPLCTVGDSEPVLPSLGSEAGAPDKAALLLVCLRFRCRPLQH